MAGTVPPGGAVVTLVDVGASIAFHSSARRGLGRAQHGVARGGVGDAAVEARSEIRSTSSIAPYLSPAPAVVLGAQRRSARIWLATPLSIRAALSLTASRMSVYQAGSRVKSFGM